MPHRTTGQVEASVCEVVARFHRDTLGRGPRSVTATLQATTLFVQLDGVLTTAEQALIGASGTNHTRSVEMIREMRNHLVQRARSELLAALSGVLGKRASATGVMHDIDPEAGSEVFVFPLAKQSNLKRLA